VQRLFQQEESSSSSSSATTWTDALLGQSIADRLADRYIADMHTLEGRRAGATPADFARVGAVVTHPHPGMRQFARYEAAYVALKEAQVMTKSQSRNKGKRREIAPAVSLQWANDLVDASVPDRKVCGKKPIVVLATDRSTGKRYAFKKVNRVQYATAAVLLHQWSVNLGLPTLSTDVVWLDVDLRRLREEEAVVVGNWTAAPSEKPVPYLRIAYVEGVPVSQMPADWWKQPNVLRQYAVLGLVAFLFGISDFNKTNVLCHNGQLMPIDRMGMLKPVRFMGRVRKEVMDAIRADHAAHLAHVLNEVRPRLLSGEFLRGTEHLFTDADEMESVRKQIVENVRKAEQEVSSA